MTNEWRFLESGYPTSIGLKVIGTQATPSEFARDDAESISFLRSDVLKHVLSISTSLLDSLLGLEEPVYQSEWISILLTCESQPSIEKITETIRALQKDIQGSKFVEISHALATQIDVDSAAIELLVAILRTSFQWKHRIPEWVELRKKVTKRLESDGLEASKVLRGL